MVKSRPIQVVFTEPEEKRGRDPLGFLGLVGRKREEILPGITGATSKAWYYLICYIYDRLKDNEKNKLLLRKKLDILFLKSNLNGNETILRGILGKSILRYKKKKKLIKKKKKLTDILNMWIKTTSYDYYWASYKRLFKNEDAESAPIDVSKIEKCLKYNKLKSISYLRLNEENQKIKNWLKKYLTPKNEGDKLSQFYQQFVNKHKNVKNKEKIIKKAFVNNIFNSTKNDVLKDIPVIEAFFWAYEAIFKVVLNLIKRKGYKADEIKPEEFNDIKAKKFLENWNEKLEKKTESESDEVVSGTSEDTSKDGRPRDDGRWDFYKELDNLISFVNYLKGRDGGVHKELKDEFGSWIESSDGSICDKILQHHFALKKTSVFIKKNRKGEWKLTKDGENHCDLPHFPKHYYGIRSYMYLVNDIEE